MKRFLFILLALLPVTAMSATCTVTEYQLLGDDGGYRVIQLPREPNLNHETVTYTTSTSSSTFNELTSMVRIKCPANAHYKFSTETEDTSATASDPVVDAGVTTDFAVPQGLSYKVEFYDGSS